MSRMQGLGRSEGGGVASERSPHEDPRGHEEFCSKEAGLRPADFKERSFPGKSC